MSANQNFRQSLKIHVCENFLSYSNHDNLQLTNKRIKHSHLSKNEPVIISINLISKQEELCQDQQLKTGSFLLMQSISLRILAKKSLFLLISVLHTRDIWHAHQPSRGLGGPEPFFFSKQYYKHMRTCSKRNQCLYFLRKLKSFKC